MHFFKYPFGSPMSGRSFSAGSYKYGFNGQQKDDEISGPGNINTALFWEYDTRLGRRWNLDPVPQIGISDYACFANNPILMTDPLGDRVKYHTDVERKQAKEMAANDKSFRKQLLRQKLDIFHLYVYHNVSGEKDNTKLAEGAGVNLQNAPATQVGEYGQGRSSFTDKFIFGKKNIFHIHYDHAEYSKTSEKSESILNWSSDQPGQSSTTTDGSGNQILTTTIPNKPPMPPEPGVRYDIQSTMAPGLMDVSVNSSVYSGGVNIGQLYNNNGSKPAGWSDKVVLSPFPGANTSNYNYSVSQFRLGISVLKVTTTTTIFSIGKDGKSYKK